MTGITEIVNLPDPAVQPLVHPLDVPEARRHFRTYYLINTLTSPPIAVLAASILWFATRNPFGPIVAATVIIALGALASTPSAWPQPPPSLSCWTSSGSWSMGSGADAVRS